MAAGTELAYNYCTSQVQLMLSFTAPTGDEPLTPDDAVNVLEEIIEAQNQSYVLGLKLRLPPHFVEDICEKHSEPRDRLLQIVAAFLQQVDPRPTWRAIVAALRSPAVNLPQLAMRVEAAHFPDPTVSRDPPPPEATTSIGKYNITMSLCYKTPLRSHKVCCGHH